MELRWFFSLFILSLCVRLSPAFLGWDLSSVLSLVHSGNNGADSLERGLSRQKRAAGDVSIPEYVVDIEISFPNASLLDDIRNYIKSLSYPIPLNTSSSVNITSINITTACKLIGSDLQCSCENSYEWPSSVCSAYKSCSASSGANCTCITELPPHGSYCQPKKVVDIKMTIKIKEDFTPDFNNPSSTKYKDYKSKLETAFNDAYKSLPGFKSATVTGFRPGSVAADYTIVAEPVDNSTFQAANTNLVGNLQKSFTLSDPPIQNRVDGLNNITVTPNEIFSGDTVTFECKVLATYTTVNWYINETQRIPATPRYTIVSGASVSTLTITNFTKTDIGSYHCIMDEGSNSYVANVNTTTIQPLKISVKNEELTCNNAETPILTCCTEGESTSFSFTCSSDFIKGLSKKDGTCWTHIINASAGQCSTLTQPLTYNCNCWTGNGANQSQLVTVRYIIPSQLQMLPSGDHLNVSEGKTISLQCTSSVDIKGINWEFKNAIVNQSINNAEYNSATRTSTLIVDKANSNWEGTFYCKSSDDNSAQANKTVAIYKLISKEQIVVTPIENFYECKKPVTFKCCVGDTTSYKARLHIVETSVTQDMTSDGKCFTASYTHEKCENFVAYCKIVNDLKDEVNSGEMKLKKLDDPPTCTGPQGIGVSDATVTIDCSTEDSNLAGNKTYRCVGSTWVESLPTGCVSAILNRLSFETSELTGPGSETKIPTFVEYLNSNVTAEKDNITSSPNNIQLVVNLLSLVDNAALVVEKNVMMNFLQTVSIVVDDNSTGSWNKIENKTDKSSLLLQSVESFGRKLQFNTNTIEINEPNVKLLGIVKTNDTTDYNKNFAFSQGNNLTGSVSIGQPALDSITGNATIVSIAYATLKDILPNTLNDKNETLNALVMTTVVSANYTSNFQISMVFQKSNKTLNVPQCVFWNFTIKSWDSSGCKAIKNEDNVSCICDHLTSFSILMSYEAVDNVALDYITYIGVGISIISLVICILVEITVWKSVTKNKTSYMRHICLVNIAVSLLIADIWFIVGAGVSTQLSDSTTSNTHIVNACVAATFFTHIFYLSLFFWMLTMGLILFYRLVYVLHDMSKTTMMAISFCTGYGFPLIISVITIAVTQPKKQYTAEKSCWLNFKESKAFIAFVVPALIIIVVNFIILLVVIVKLLRPSIGDKPRKEEKSTLIHIGKSIAILTPLLGLTWGFGIGTIANNSVWVHGIFAALNSLQGLFILLFGCLLDRKVRDGMFGRLSISRWSSQQTKSNTVSTSEIPFSRGFINIFSKKGAYNISSAQMSSSSDTPSNVYSLLT